MSVVRWEETICQYLPRITITPPSRPAGLSTLSSASSSIYYPSNSQCTSPLNAESPAEALSPSPGIADLPFLLPHMAAGSTSGLALASSSPTSSAGTCLSCLDSLPMVREWEWKNGGAHHAHVSLVNYIYQNTLSASTPCDRFAFLLR